jgi:hypothetical protein
VRTEGTDERPVRRATLSGSPSRPISIPRTTFSTPQQPRPIRNGHPGAVLRDLSGQIGLGPVITAFAPHDEPDMHSERGPSVIRSMPLPDLSPEEHTPKWYALCVPRSTATVTPCRRGPIGKSILAKLEPAFSSMPSRLTRRRGRAPSRASS